MLTFGREEGLWAFVTLEPDESRRGVEARGEQDSPVSGE